MEELERGLLLSRVVQSGRHLREELEACLRGCLPELTPQILELLRSLAIYGRCTRAELGRVMRMRPQSLHVPLRQVEKVGWVRRNVTPGQRFVYRELTACGETVVEKALQATAADLLRRAGDLAPIGEPAAVLSCLEGEGRNRWSQREVHCLVEAVAERERAEVDDVLSNRREVHPGAVVLDVR
jgi:DNA-binding MarR family transcriptional regulator